MKAIVLIAAIALVALGIFAVLSQMQRQSTDNMIRQDASGFFAEKRQEARAASMDGTEPIPYHQSVSAPSWLELRPNPISRWMRALESLVHVHRQRLAPPGVYFTLRDFSVRKPSGLIGVSPGTQVVCVKDEGPLLRVKTGNLEFDAERQYLTNDLEFAELAVRNDAAAQQAVASDIAKQQQAINQRDGSKMKPSNQR